MRGRETGEVVAAARYEGGFLPAAASRRHTPAAKGQDLLRKAKKMTNGARTTALPTAGGWTGGVWCLGTPLFLQEGTAAPSGSVLCSQCQQSPVTISEPCWWQLVLFFGYVALKEENNVVF